MEIKHDAGVALPLVASPAGAHLVKEPAPVIRRPNLFP